jgi:anti-sigma factor RsiW
MKEPRSFTDEDLTAYLDGEVDTATERAIATALVSDVGLRERLASLQISVVALDEAFGCLLAAAPALPALPMQATSGAPGQIPKMAMAACLVLGIAFGAGLMSWRAQPADWKDYVAAYQSLYVNATLASVAMTPDETVLNLAYLGAVLDHDISAAQTDSILQFKRGQLLGYQGQPLVQLAYLTLLGEPMALCIIRIESDGQSDVKLTNLEGMAAAHWEKDGLAYLLIGGTDTALINDAANRMVDRL